LGYYWNSRHYSTFFNFPGSQPELWLTADQVGSESSGSTTSPSPLEVVAAGPAGPEDRSSRSSPGEIPTPSPRPQSSAGRPISIFFSYSRKDQRLRDSLETCLATMKREGLIAAWHDRMIDPGMDWAREIDEHLESAQLILLLVSMDFLASRYCYEVEMTRALQKHQDGEAWVIPVILRPSDWQKTPFGALNALPENGRPVTSWRDRDEAFLSIAQGIRTVIGRIRAGQSPSTLREGSKRDSSEVLPGLSSATPVGQVLPKLIVEPIPGTGVIPVLETGTVSIDSPFYEPRDSDRLAAAQLDANSTNPTVVIKGSRQSGKSSLLARLAHAATQRGDRSCYLNLQDMDDQSLGNTALLFLALARTMVRELEVNVDPDEVWESLMKENKNEARPALTSFLEDVILEAEPTSLLVVFDEVDVAFDYPATRGDLFKMIRSWHERRQRAERDSPRKRLRLAIGHATNPALWIKDLSQSPFNVGRRLVLVDFNDRQVADLNQKHGSPLAGAGEVERLMNLIGGHPHLVRIALYTLAAEKWSLDELERVACELDSPFAHHLNDYLDAVRRDRVLTKEVRSILKRRVCSNDRIFQKLWAAGLIQSGSPNAVQMRCRLYHDFFELRL
jgi:hypothetical protein